ncbi:hypothetical protein TUBRATIS_009830 [Tubulinosema ratisbonensis]|uniref:Uncharacterized protein n=1 Tax=Tubulinosema ratisbonensis TaxID=291195 RepID=A0A437AMX8_9MICR|nr:hypothetical protein TUBRATIS_009830 [Tubulinosema ratisbonensis]
MHKPSTSTLFHQLLTEIKCPFLYSIVSSNENNILKQVNSFSLDKCTFVELFIQLDLLTLCNQFPSIANQLFTNSCSILQYVKENVIQILTKLFKNLTNLTAYKKNSTNLCMTKEQPPDYNTELQYYTIKDYPINPSKKYTTLKNAQIQLSKKNSDGSFKKLVLTDLDDSHVLAKKFNKVIKISVSAKYDIPSEFDFSSGIQVLLEKGVFNFKKEFTYEE